jgi:hypothetical protein
MNRISRIETCYRFVDRGSPFGSAAAVIAGKKTRDEKAV